jgi:hypothetical protein
MTPRPPMSTGQKVAAGIIFSFLAFVVLVMAASMNHDPYADDTSDPVAEACADAVGVGDTARLARCIANVGAGVTQDDAGGIGWRR